MKTMQKNKVALMSLAIKIYFSHLIMAEIVQQCKIKDITTLILHLKAESLSEKEKYQPMQQNLSSKRI